MSNSISSSPSKKRKPESIRRKSAAREAVIHALYAKSVDAAATTTSSPNTPEAVSKLSDTAYFSSPPDMHHLNRVVEGVAANCTDIDRVITEHLASDWRLERLSLPLISILRAGAFELMMIPEIPKNAIIDEYVTLAQRYCEGKEASFVNGFLDRLGTRVRE